MSLTVLAVLSSATILGSPTRNAASELVRARSELTACHERSGRAAQSPQGHEGECTDSIKLLVFRGDRSDHRRLWALYDSYPQPRYWIRSYFLWWRAEQAIEEARPGGPLKLDESWPLPHSLDRAAPELQHAFRAYAFLRAKRPPAPPGDPVEFFLQDDAFDRAVADFLRGRSGPEQALLEVGRFRWGSWCGTGAGTLTDARDHVVLIASLQLGRLDWAIGAALRLWASRAGFEEWPRRLLALGEVDWETVWLGAVLDGETEAAESLARDGSDESVGRLLAAASLDHPERQPLRSSPALLDVIARIARPVGASRQTMTPEADGAPRPLALQEGALDRLASSVAQEAGEVEAHRAAALLLKLSRPESREAFHTMLVSPHAEVRRCGVSGLRALGEELGGLPSVVPVRFRVSIDGQPLVGARVAWVLSGGGAETAASTELEGDGVLPLERSRFVDPVTPVARVLLTSLQLRSREDTWFAVDLERPADLEQITEVGVRTGSLRVRTPPPQTGRPPVSLQLFAHLPRHGWTQRRPVSLPLPITSDTILFPHLQHGTYSVAVTREREVVLRSTEVRVGDEPAEVRVSAPQAGGR